MNEQLDVLKLVAERLQQVDIAYMISGSIALNYYAQPRLTRDIDIVVALRREDAERVINLFAEDCYIDADAVRNAIAQLGMFNIIHYDHVLKVDCIVRKDTPYRQLVLCATYPSLGRGSAGMGGEATERGKRDAKTAWPQGIDIAVKLT